MISNARNAVRAGNGGEGGAIIESISSNARYAVVNAVVCDGFGDGGGCQTCIVIRCPIVLVRYLHGRIAGDVVVEVTRLEVIRPEGGGSY